MISRSPWRVPVLANKGAEKAHFWQEQPGQVCREQTSDFPLSRAGTRPKRQRSAGSDSEYKQPAGLLVTSKESTRQQEQTSTGSRARFRGPTLLSQNTRKPPGGASGSKPTPPLETTCRTAFATQGGGVRRLSQPASALPGRSRLQEHGKMPATP